VSARVRSFASAAALVRLPLPELLELVARLEATPRPVNDPPAVRRLARYRAAARRALAVRLAGA